MVETTIEELPPQIKTEAEKVPVLFEAECEDDPDILGIHSGDFTPGIKSGSNGPIILYLATIENLCDEECEDFDEQVRLTYLHELGHHLGWDEGDLEERGLA